MSAISPVLAAVARMLLIASVVSIGFVGLLLLESEQTKKFVELISRTKR